MNKAKVHHKMNKKQYVAKLYLAAFLLNAEYERCTKVKDAESVHDFIAWLDGDKNAEMLRLWSLANDRKQVGVDVCETQEYPLFIYTILFRFMVSYSASSCNRFPLRFCPACNRFNPETSVCFKSIEPTGDVFRERHAMSALKLVEDQPTLRMHWNMMVPIVFALSPLPFRSVPTSISDNDSMVIDDNEMLKENEKKKQKEKEKQKEEEKEKEKQKEKEKEKQKEKEKEKEKQKEKEKEKRVDVVEVEKAIVKPKEKRPYRMINRIPKASLVQQQVMAQKKPVTVRIQSAPSSAANSEYASDEDDDLHDPPASPAIAVQDSPAPPPVKPKRKYTRRMFAAADANANKARFTSPNINKVNKGEPLQYVMSRINREHNLFFEHYQLPLIRVFGDDNLDIQQVDNLFSFVYKSNYLIYPMNDRTMQTQRTRWIVLFGSPRTAQYNSFGEFDDAKVMHDLIESDIAAMSQQGGVIESHVDVQAYNNYKNMSPYQEDGSQSEDDLHTINNEYYNSLTSSLVPDFAY